MLCPQGFESLPRAAARLQVNYRTVRGLIRRGTLRGGRSGHMRHWYVNTDDVTAHLAARVAGTLDALTTPQQESVT